MIIIEKYYSEVFFTSIGGLGNEECTFHTVLRGFHFILKVFLCRLHELQKGSRALFGEIVEDYIYILIDTSQSMKDKLSVVKEKIFQLIRVSDNY